MQPDTPQQFMEMKPTRDYWKLVWKVVIGINLLLVVIPLVLIGLKLGGINVEGLGEVAIISSFWLIPLIIVADLAVLGSYFLFTQAKLQDLVKPAIWVGGSCLAAFLAISGYVTFVSVS